MNVFLGIVAQIDYYTLNSSEVFMLPRPQYECEKEEWDWESKPFP